MVRKKKKTGKSGRLAPQKSKGSLTGMRSGIKNLAGSGKKKKKKKLGKMWTVLLWTAIIFALIFALLWRTNT